MGGELGMVIDALFAVDPASLTDEQIITEMRELRVAVNRLEGRWLQLLEKIDRRGMKAAEHGATQAWLRNEPLMDGRAAHRAVRLARNLADAMPATAATLNAGEITPEHARVIAKLRPHATPESFAKAEAELADLAPELGVSHLNDAVTATIHSLKPEEKIKDERDAFDRRNLHASASLDGIGYGTWTLDPVSHDTVMTAIHAASAPITDDLRTPAQRRADGLIQIARFFMKHAGPDDDLPTDHGTPPQVTVIAAIDTLMRMAGATPATTGTGATISGEAARRIACDANISRIITGPNSAILDAGRSMRPFTAAARRAIAARDQHCRWKGCNAPASWCEYHHIKHWADGGESNPDNGILLCSRHHDRLHNHRHQTIIKPDGSRHIRLQRDSADHGWVDDQRITATPTGGPASVPPAKPPDRPPD